MTRQPTLRPKKLRLLKRIGAMPVPGVLDLTGAEWIPSEPWLRKVPGVTLSVRRSHENFYLFRIK